MSDKRGGEFGCNLLHAVEQKIQTAINESAVVNFKYLKSEMYFQEIWCVLRNVDNVRIEIFDELLNVELTTTRVHPQLAENGDKRPLLHSPETCHNYALYIMRWTEIEYKN